MNVNTPEVRIKALEFASGLRVSDALISQTQSLTAIELVKAAKLIEQYINDGNVHVATPAESTSRSSPA